MSDALLWFLIGIGLAFVGLFTRDRMFGFIGQKAIDYEDGDPDFDLRTHLNGKLICEGVIFGPMGRMTSSFVARFDARWDGDVGVIDEHFVYNDGQLQERQWTLTLAENGRFSANAPDVPGEGWGEQAGPAVLFQYPIKLPDDAGGYVLRAFDCMYMTAEGTIINRSQFRKFGIKVAELVATIRREES